MMDLVKVNPHPLKIFFQENGVPQWQLARLLNCSQQKVSLILRGLQPPNRNEAKELKKIVGKVKKMKR